MVHDQQDTHATRARVINICGLFPGDDGWMPCKNDQEIKCFGILHVPEISNPITSGGIDGIEYLQQTIKTLSGIKKP